MSDYIPEQGYIYLIKMCDTDNLIIYKIGKSINFYKRFQKYDFAKILIFINSDDITNDEYEIIKLFKINCKLHKGREFFTSQNDSFVLDLFMTYFSNKNKKNIENNIIANIVNDVVSNDVVSNDVVSNDVVSNDVVSNDVVSNVVVSNDMKISERTCPTCKKLFNFSSRLKAHLETTIHCKKSPDDINKFFKQFEKKSNFICEICCSKYTKLQNLQRHIQNTNCKIVIKKNKLLNDIEIMKQEINKLK